MTRWTRIEINPGAIASRLARNKVAALIGLGIAFRVVQYLHNRPYWMDEAALVGNIRRKTFLGLFGPLSQTQLAPPGFLAVEWLASRILGDYPLALRLVPLMGGIASLFLLHRLAVAILRPGAVAIAVALFAVADDLIYFASELKQYSTDLAIGLACTLMGLAAARDSSPSRLAVLASAGALAVWFSHPAAFVLAGVGTTLFLSALAQKDWRRAGLLMPVGLAWAASLAGVYAVSLRQLDHRPDMWSFWDFAFPPRPPRSIADALWPLRRGLFLFLNPLDFSTPLGPGLSALAPCLLFFAGCMSLARRDAHALERLPLEHADRSGCHWRLARQCSHAVGALAGKPPVAPEIKLSTPTKTALAMLATPAAFALLAAYLRLFPFHGRLVLFLVPALLLPVAEGAAWACEAVNRRWSRAIVLGLLLLFPTLRDVYYLAGRPERSGLNPYGDRRDWRLNPDDFPWWGR